MKKNRLLTLILVVVMAFTALVSCGSSDLDTGVFVVEAPSDWEIQKRTVDGSAKDDQVNVIKGGSDTTSCPHILISYYKDPSKYKDERSFYKDAKDVEPVEAGDRQWEGYSYSLFGSSEACLTAKDGDGLWVCKFALEKGGEKISIDEKDVKEILSSLKVK